MFENKKFKRIIALSFSTCLFYSCNKNSVEYSNMDSANEKRINAISLSAANSTFHDGTSSHVSYADMAQRVKNCSIDNLEFKNEIKEIFKEYNNKDLLSHVGNTAIPLVSILDKITKLTHSEKPANANIYACYYPELYLANALLMNTLQRVPLAPFNQESLLTSHSTDDPAESENWNEQDNFNKSRFAKLNGLIRSATIALQLAEKERRFSDKIPRIYSFDKKGNKQYLFGFKENISEESLDYQLRAFAEALSAIGFYERAIYRWNGVTSAKELNMPVTLPNESLQDDLEELNTQYPDSNPEEHNNKKLPLKLVIAADLLNAGQFATAALSGNNCNKNNTSNDVPTHFNSMCSELATIKEKAIKIDLKRLVCSSASKVEIEKSPADNLANMFWEEAECDKYIKSEPELANSYLNLKGLSYNFVNPASLNPLRLQERLKFLQSKFEGLKGKTSQINLLQTHDFENKKQEIFDNIEFLKNEFEVSKKLVTKASSELEFNRNQLDATQILFDGSQNEIEQAKIQQKNQFRNYVLNLSALQKLKSVKKSFDNYSSQKLAEKQNNAKDLCSNGNSETCSFDIRGIISNLTKEKYEIATNDWKNNCGKLVNRLNSVTAIIGNTGCDLSAVMNELNTPEYDANNFLNIFRKLPKTILPACKMAVISEARTRLKDSDFEKSLSYDEKTINYCRSTEKSKQENNLIVKCDEIIKNLDSFKGIINYLYKDFSYSSKSEPGYFSGLQNNINYANTVAMSNAEKIYIENYLGVNAENRHLLTEPQKFCSAILEYSENGHRPKFASILDARIEIEQAELQSLQINQSMTQLQIEIDNIQAQFKNLENILRIDEELTSKVLNSLENFADSNYFDSFYIGSIENIRFTELETAIDKQKIYKAQLQATKASEKVAQESLSIAQLQTENLQFSIARAKAKYQSHENSSVLITSLSPNLQSFLNYIPDIYKVSALAKDYLNLATNKILNMPSGSRILAHDHYTNILDLVSRTKVNCSYLASFYDAQNCLVDLSTLQEKLLFKNNSLYSQQKILSLQIYSSDYRDSMQFIADDSEQIFDNQFLDNLNAKGLSSLNFDEKFLSIKNLILDEFNNEHYNSRLIDVTVNIIQDNPRINQYNSYPFSVQANLAYLMHDGLDKNSLNSDQCGENFSNYSNNQYNEFMTKIDYEKDQYALYGKSFPYLFDPLHAQNSMCTKVKTTYSELPDEINYLDNRFSSLKWVQLLSKDPNSSPLVNDAYWKPLTGYLSNTKNILSNLEQHTNQLSGCLNSDDLNSSSCASAKASVEHSFAGLPLLGNYTFVYAPFHLDKKVNQKRKSDQKIKTVGVEFNFIISN
ncbi:coiled-coil domain-containing protein [Fluviispira sanaruensis]|uniref:Uncharacterized protein n=1 Tax=Fluviispira sanaruensis TaxID=2493639 RepID=A0A4P2VN89_FLUSA|nr:hypothetical protein [Fluviispira sanaruensis]BBH53574.1 hypothetical protein JCM31447_20180 [Fluviispira sanaruensis]